MMRYRYVVLVVVLAFAKAEFLKAQDKQERESSVERADFPELAQKQLDVFTQKGRAIKFYREIDGEIVSYEMKLKIDGRRHSVEFNDKGVLEDVEVTVNKRKISEEAAQNIQIALDQICPKNKIEKVQWQFLPKNQDVKSIIDRIAREKFDHYEIIVAFKEKRKIYRKELLFSSDGTLINSRDIKRIAYDFLLF